jgi:hypothetical protein
MWYYQVTQLIPGWVNSEHIICLLSDLVTWGYVLRNYCESVEGGANNCKHHRAETNSMIEMQIHTQINPNYTILQLLVAWASTIWFGRDEVFGGSTDRLELLVRRYIYCSWFMRVQPPVINPRLSSVFFKPGLATQCPNETHGIHRPLWLHDS